MGQIITFYSFKGGVGRSLALANVAVLMVDWDLEAPGLENFFKDFIDLEEIKNKPGIIDILLDHDKSETGSHLDWLKWITEVKITNINEKLHLITAGQSSSDYYTKVRNLNVDKFYLEQEGGQFIENMRNYWLETYDFVLIDSKTGITDIGGICTVQLPDILLLLFTAAELKIAGFTPWLDRENLRGGDNWDSKIQKVIYKGIDYFVVLLSRALAEKRVGYVIKEIKMALDRQKEFRPGIRFIIPVKIEECILPDELKPFHILDLAVENNIKALIDTIQRDYAKRLK